MGADTSPDWAALGQPLPRAISLNAAARARLSHLAELRDISTPADAARASAEVAGERWFAADLLAVRPWLAADTPRRGVLSALLDTEWAGFLALLGEHGPWVYAASVRDLQCFSALYGTLVGAASRAREDDALSAARSLTAYPSLLARLEGTDYRRPAGSPPELAALEAAFWQQAAAQAAERRADWQARRSAGR